MPGETSNRKMKPVEPVGLAGVAIAAIASSGLLADDDHGRRNGGNDCEGDKALALVNGRIHTMDGNDSIVSSVLIGDGKFLSVGNRFFCSSLSRFALGDGTLFRFACCRLMRHDGLPN